MKIVYLASHPIQYHAPLFRALAARCEFEAWFAHRPSPAEQGAAGYGVAFDWDIDLLAGYPNRFLENVARAPTVLRPLGADTPQVAAWLGASRPDALILGGWMLKSYWQAFRAAKRLGIPSWVRTDSRWLPGETRLKAVAKRALYRFALRRPQGFLAAGQAARDYLTSLGVPGGRIAVIPHAIDVDRFAARRVDPASTRERFGLGGGPLAGFVGRLLPGKRVADLIRAAARLQAPRPGVVIVGDGPEAGPLRELAETLDVACVFVGFRNQAELPELYQTLDVLVLPSAMDTWGLVVNEALAAGASAVVSDAVGSSASLAAYAPAVLVHRLGDSDDLARQLAAALRARGSEETERQRRRAVAILRPERVAEEIVTTLARSTA